MIASSHLGWSPFFRIWSQRGPGSPSSAGCIVMALQILRREFNRLEWAGRSREPPGPLFSWVGVLPRPEWFPLLLIGVCEKTLFELADPGNCSLNDSGKLLRSGVTQRIPSWGLLGPARPHRVFFASLFLWPFRPGSGRRNEGEDIPVFRIGTQLRKFHLWFTRRGASWTIRWRASSTRVEWPWWEPAPNPPG